MPEHKTSHIIALEILNLKVLAYIAIQIANTIYLSNRPHFLWVYRRDNPRGMLGEHERSF